jgi:hypothetical protein
MEKIMVLTLDLPVRYPLPVEPLFADPLEIYARKFGAVPAWFDEIPLQDAWQLSRQALRNGVPLAAADNMN